MELLPSQEEETVDGLAKGVGDRLATGVGDVLNEAFVDDRPDEDRNRTSRVNKECDEALIRESVDRAEEEDISAETCEAFNKAILQACDKPMITLMEMIKNYLMKRLVKKMAELEKWTYYIRPNVFRIVEKLKIKSSICQPEYSGNLKYQVRCPGDDQYMVDIDTKTCACNRWQLIRILYIYGILCILSSNCDPIDYIDYRYKKESCIRTYAPIIYVINGPRIWLKTNDKPLQCLQFKK
ncbi:hypothetical protein QYF36_016774 [Acer negundo]|nr:hypothetical protein QYF36_016774 [Acer negundo]